MPVFPVLKTSAVAQYPLRSSVSFRTFRHRFLDRSEQCFRLSSEPVRSWRIDLSQLDPEEIARLESFFSTVRGRDTAFEFTDPHDGSVHANCVLEDDVLLSQMADAADARTSLVIRTLRS